MISVIIVVPSISRSGGGVTESVRLLADALKKHTDLTIQIVTTKDSNFDEDIGAWQGHDVRAFSFCGPANYRFSPGMLWHLLKSRADLMHVHGVWMFHCLAVILWSFLTGKPYVVSPHGMLERWIVARSPWLKRIVSILYQNHFLQRTHTFHILTEKERHDVAEFVGNARCELIPNYVPICEAVVKQPAWWVPSYSDKTIYLFFGRIHDKKGWRELCTAWSELCAVSPTFAKTSLLVFCGWQDTAAGFEGTVEKLAQQYHNAIYAGPQFGAHKAASLRVCDFFILPSKSEGLPMVILEAWAAGRPVLMTDACNLPIGFLRGAALRIGEQVPEIIAGLETANSLRLADRDKMSVAATQLIQDKFSDVVVAAGMTTLYDLKASK